MDDDSGIRTPDNPWDDCGDYIVDYRWDYGVDGDIDYPPTAANNPHAKLLLTRDILGEITPEGITGHLQLHVTDSFGETGKSVQGIIDSDLVWFVGAPSASLVVQDQFGNVIPEGEQIDCGSLIQTSPRCAPARRSERT